MADGSPGSGEEEVIWQAALCFNGRKTPEKYEARWFPISILKQFCTAGCGLLAVALSDTFV